MDLGHGLFCKYSKIPPFVFGNGGKFGNANLLIYHCNTECIVTVCNLFAV